MVVDNTKEEENMKEVGNAKEYLVHNWSNDQMATEVVDMKDEEMFLKFTKMFSFFFPFIWFQFFFASNFFIKSIPIRES